MFQNQFFQSTNKTATWDKEIEYYFNQQIMSRIIVHKLHYRLLKKQSFRSDIAVSNKNILHSTFHIAVCVYST